MPPHAFHPPSDPAAVAVSALREALVSRIDACCTGAVEFWTRDTSAELANVLIADPLAPLLADIAALRTRAEEAETRAARINDKLGELNAAVRESLPPVETLIAEREAANARADSLETELAEARAALEKLTNGCPWDGPASETAMLAPDDPCPICGDLGSLNADAEKPSRCVAFAQSRKHWRALTTAKGDADVEA